MKINRLVVLCAFSIFIGCEQNGNKKSGIEVSEKKLVKEDSLNNAKMTLNEKIKSDTAVKWFDTTWFEISYPADFTATGSLKSSTSTEGFDSAFFTSPDGKVQFYVYSPQWNGVPKDIALNPKTEMETDRTQEKKANVTVTRWTISAKDDSYKRSYEDMSIANTTNRVFGIKYTSDAEREKYLPQYLRFKKSLLQYAD